MNLRKIFASVLCLAMLLSSMSVASFAPVQAATSAEGFTDTVLGADASTDLLIAPKDNLFANATMTSTGAVPTDARLWDGVVSPMTAYTDANQAWMIHAGWACFDLGTACDIQSILIGGCNKVYGMYDVDIYVGNADYKTIAANPDAYTKTAYISNDLTVDKNSAGNARLIKLNSAVSGRYVVFRFSGLPEGYDKNNIGRIWITELAAAGTGAPVQKTASSIVCIGDSITWGHYFPPSAGSGGTQLDNTYPEQLEALLNADETDIQYTVHNIAVSGTAMVDGSLLETNDGVKSWYNAKFNSVKGTIAKADAALIMLGTNDAAANYRNSWNGDAGNRRDFYKQEYRKLVAALKEANPDITVYVVTSPVALREPYYTNLSADVVPMQLQLAAELDLPVVDVYNITRDLVRDKGESAFIDSNEINGLRVHPGEQGAAVIAEACYNAITKGNVHVSELKSSATADTDAAKTLSGNTAAGVTPDANRIIPTGHNMLTANGVKISGYQAESGKCYLADGLLRYVNVTEGTNHNAGCSQVTVDFGQTAAITQVLLGGCQAEANSATFLYPGASIYVTDDPENKGEAVWSITDADKDGTVAGRIITFPRAVHGRYLIISIPTKTTSGTTNAWLSEIAAVGEFAEPIAEKPAEPYTRVPVTSMADLPSNNLIAGKEPTLANGDRPGVVAGGSLANMTDGLIQGINQDVHLVLTQNTADLTATSSGNTYYSYIAAKSLVEAQGKDTSQTWYVKPNNGRWMATNTEEQRAVLRGGSNNAANIVYDLGSKAVINSLLLASSVELAGLTNNTYYNGDYDATKHPVMTEDKVAEALTPAADKRLLYKGKVYVGDSRSSIFSAGNLVLEFDFTDDYDKAWRNLWTLSESVTGRYVGFELNDTVFSSSNLFVRISELGVYGEMADISDDDYDDYKITQLTTDNANLIPATNLLAGLQGYDKSLSAKAEGYKATATNGIIGGVTMAGAEENRCDINSGSSQYAYVTYMLPKETTISKLLVSGSIGDDVAGTYGGVTYDNQHVANYQIYMANRPNELYKESSLVVDYTNPHTVDGEGVTQLIELSKTVKCRYIGFALSKAAYNRVRISELGAYGVTGQVAIKANDPSMVPRDKNLLTNASYTMLSGSAQSMQEGTDGIIGRVNVPTGYTNQMSFGYNPKMYYDLGDSKTIDRLLFANNGSDNGDYLCQGYAFYLGDDPETLFNSEPVVKNTTAASKDYPANLHILDTPVTARYVGITVTGCSKDNGTRIAEVGAYAAKAGDVTHEAIPEDLTGDLLADVTPTVAGNRTTYQLANVSIPDTFAVTSTAPGKVYASVSAEDLFADENRVADFAAGGDLLTLGKAAEGLYIGFETDDAAATFAAYERAVTLTLLDGTDEYTEPTASAALIPENNLLTGVSPMSFSISDGKLSTTGSSVAYGTDGLIAGINSPLSDATKMSFGGNARVVYSLGYRAEISQLLMSSNREGLAHYVDHYEIYVSDTIEDLFSSNSLVVSYDNRHHVQGQLFTLAEPVMGKYVGLITPSTSYGQVRIEEFGAYGKRVTDVTQILHNNHVSLIPSGTSLLKDKLPCNVDANVSDGAKATDGKLYGIQYANRYYRSQDGMFIYSTPINSTVTYELSDTAAVVEKILVQSFSNVQDITWQMRHYSIFVGSDMDTLYTAANRVYIYESDKPAMGQVITLSTPAVGQYIGFMFHGDDTTKTVMGNNYIFRVGELAVYGSVASSTSDSRIVGAGTQLRDGDNGLRFGTVVQTQGAHGVLLTGDTVYYKGATRKIKTAGTLLVQADKLGDNTLAFLDDGSTPDYVKNVRASRLYDSGNGYAVYTAVVTGIPTEHYDTAIAARGYVRLDDGTVLYGDVITRTVNQTKAAVDDTSDIPVDYEVNESKFAYTEGNLTFSTFNSFDEIRFSHKYADGKTRTARIAVPDKVAPGNHWVYQAEFYGHKDAGLDAAVQLVRDGWYLVYLEGIGDTYGSPATVKIMAEFHDILVEQFGFYEKTVMLGISRGGLYSVNYALTYPEKVAGLYLDAPVQDICSWPGGRQLNNLIEELYANGKPAGALRDYRTYKGGGSRGQEYSGTGLNEWEGCLKAFGFKSEADAILNDTASPIYRYQELIDSGIKVLLQISTADTLVYPDENGYKLYDAYEAAGKTVRRVNEPSANWLLEGGAADCVMVTASRTQSGRGGHVHGWHNPKDTSAYVRTYMCD